MSFSIPFGNLEPPVRRSLWATFWSGLLFWSSLASQLPTFPLFVRSLGANFVELGWVMGAFAVGLLSCRAKMGFWSDTKGRRFVMRIGLTVALVVPIIYAILPFLPWVTVMRAVHGISVAAFATAYGALAADLAPAHQRGEVIGYMSLVNPLGLAFGPALGGFLMEHTNYQTLFLTAALLAGIGLWLTTGINECREFAVAPVQKNLATAPKSWNITEDSAESSAAHDPTPEINKPAINKQEGNKLISQVTVKAGFWETLLNPRIRIGAFMLLIIGLVFGSLSTFLPVLMKAKNIPLNAGLFYMMAAVASLFTRLFLSKWSDRLGRGLFVSIGLCFYGASMLIIAEANSSSLFLLSGALEGIGSGLFVPAVMSLVADRTLPHERGYVLGLTWIGFDLGIATAGPILGACVDWLSLAGVFMVAASLSVIALIVFCLYGNQTVSSSLGFAMGRARDGYALD
jgi:MFS family permease